MKKMKRLTALALTGILVMTSISSTCFAAGKTIQGYKANNYSGISDAQTMVSGVKNQVSTYTGSVKTSSITKNDFLNKSHCIKYWASHGYNSCRLTGDNMTPFYYDDTLKWSGSNLEFVFLAACNQLDANGNNPRAIYANAMVGSNAVRAICGYHELAPGSGQYQDAAVARYFLSYAGTGESVKSSWILANTDYGNMDYCVLTHSGNPQYSRFEGFPGLTYTRPGAYSTTILRFTSAYPDGTSQPYSLNLGDISKASNNGDASLDITLPNYQIKATPVDVSVKENINTTVLSNETGLKTLSGEIKDTEIKLTEADAKAMAEQWLNASYNGVDANTFKNRDVDARAIVVAEVDLEGDVSKEIEKTVAYSVRFDNKFNGVKVVGDHFSAIIDDTGIVSSSVKNNNYEIIESKNKISPITLAKAASILSDELKTNERLANFEKSVSNIEIAFCDNDNDGVYDPAYSFKMANGKTMTVNAISGKVVF